jgi:magnesium transporter
MASTRAWRDGVLVAEGFPVAQISDYLENGDCTVWADFVSPSEDDLAAIQEELGLHDLAIEDAVHEHQRAKLDRYDSHLFLATYDVAIDDDIALVKTEVKAFITPRAFITVHDESFDISRLTERWDGVAALAGNGSSYLLWGLLDVVSDAQFEAVQVLDTAADELEELLFDDDADDQEVQRRSFELRKSLVMLRRVVLPSRDVAAALLRHEQASERRAMVPYFQDVYDHVLRTTEWTDTVRELIATILETSIGIRSNRMNLIMKKVTSWAAIIAVPTAITGYFGQNLLFPGFGTAWGTVLSSALILVVGFTLYFSFKRRDWL